MKTKILITLLLMLSLSAFASGDSIKSEKLGHLFYLKTEVLKPLVLFTVEPNASYFDIQGTVRLSNYLHFTLTYGVQKIYVEQKLEPTNSDSLHQYSLTTGLATYMTSGNLRYYPFHNTKQWVDYIFLEGGYHFHYYDGKEMNLVYNNTILQNDNEMTVQLMRHGPEFNMGVCQFFLPKPKNRDKRKITFAPEFYIGFRYLTTKVLSEEFINNKGFMEDPGYSEADRLIFHLRLRLGIGFL